MQPIDAFAYYLPQFYPVVHNSQWWGPGYTEWNALLTTQRGIRSPRDATITPGELGFYDLRVAETRRRQGELARAAGISAFCIYHYFSGGRRILADVVDALLSDGYPAFPFFLCWANHDWTLAWQGKPKTVTWAQEYDADSDDQHFQWLLEVFSDSRYFKIGNAPVLAVYDAEAVPSSHATFARWRQMAVTHGFSGLVLLGLAHEAAPQQPADVGIDAWVQSAGSTLGLVSRRRRVLSAILGPVRFWRFLRYGDYVVSRTFLSRLLEQSRRSAPVPLVPAVISSFNNVGRRRRRAWYLKPAPDAFGRDLESAISSAPLISSPDGSRRLLAVNAWNEWGEAMAIEPSVEDGDALLRVMAKSLGKVPAAS